MKPAEKIKRLIRDRRYKVSPEVYDKTLGSFLQAVDEHLKQKVAPTEPKIWRTIMKSRITKSAAAAVIIIAGFIVIYQSGGSIDIATISFAQITQNMKQMPWMHAVMEAAGDRLEAWFSFERRVMASKRAGGEVRYQDDLKQTVELYNPNVNTVTVSRGTPHALAGMGSAAFDLPKIVLKLFEDAGEQVIHQTGRYKGKDANIFKMSGLLGGRDMKVEMAVDANINVVLHINQKVFDKTGKLATEVNAYFDYPEKGPESIYDVGVPRSAKTVRGEKETEKTAYDKAFEEAISKIDNAEKWYEPRDLVIAYWQARTQKNYDEMAVFWPGSAIWNRKALQKEEPVEYVFRTVQATKIEGHVVVPYASKGYYEEHGKYGLKMRLSNEKSAKGRYYIISGN
jgi:hypothetical protein